MPSFNLPRAHTLKAQWAPLLFYPMIGSSDCITVALAVVCDDGTTHVLEANNLAKLNCLMETDGENCVIFVRSAVKTIREELKKLGRTAFNTPLQLGSSFQFGAPRVGSGFDVAGIAESWLNKVSVVHNRLDEPSSHTGLIAMEAASLPKERQIVPAIRDEAFSINPELAQNFNVQFQPADRSLPVKMGYLGNKIVANFDRVSVRNVGSSLEKVRSKLWILAEHRAQTRHQPSKQHEMLVVPAIVNDRIGYSHNLDLINSACADIEKEADRREIRFRRFENPKEVAQHIYRTEMAA